MPIDLDLPERFNLADWLLDARVREGRGERVALRLPDPRMDLPRSPASRQPLRQRAGRARRAREERVFVALPDGAELVGALFGVLKSGAVGVMVNPELPDEAVAALVDYPAPRLAGKP